VSRVFYIIKNAIFEVTSNRIINILVIVYKFCVLLFPKDSTIIFESVVFLSSEILE
ncbi:hypothetical protein L9F63_020338, partial [Diploptera punctata]